MEDKIRLILNQAVFAPSGDNSQPWKFTLNANKLKIYNLPNKDHPLLNFQQRGSYIAHGALVENINILSSGFGLKADFKFFPKSDEKDLIAIVDFTNASVRTDHELASSIILRHTNRKAYKSTEIELDIQNYILECKYPNSNLNLHWISNRKQIEKISIASSKMEKIALETKELHHNFFKDIIWNKNDYKSGKEGLYIKTLELPIIIEKIFKFLKYWPIAKMLNTLGFSSLAAFGNSKLYSKSGAYIAISSKSTTQIDYIQCGILMQNLWLRTTNKGLSLQPVSGIIFIAQRLLLGLPLKLTKENAKLAINQYQVIKNEFNINNDEVLMIFRVGYTDKLGIKSYRQKPYLVNGK
ncbi:MAG: nitroreductase family protein [Patescibacteria group bacterium]